MECNICFELYNSTINKPYSLYSCGHTYCIKCINRLTEPTCPMCNANIKDILPNFAILAMIGEPAELINEPFKLNEAADDPENSFKLYKNKFTQIFQAATLTTEEILNLIDSEFTEFDFNSILFIRALVTSLVRSCLDANNRLCKKQSKNKLMNLFPVFTKYITLNQEFEMETLHAIQTLDQKLKHPGFISSLLITLYQGKLISNQVFLNWKANMDDNYAKGNAKHLLKFFDSLPNSVFTGKLVMSTARVNTKSTNVSLPSQSMLHANVFPKRERKPLLIVDPITKNPINPQL